MGRQIKNKKNKKNRILFFYIPLFVFMITLGIVWIALYLRKEDWNHFIFFCIISLIISFLISILLIFQRDVFLYNNRVIIQFMIVYALGIFLAIGSAFLPYYVWVFLCLQ